MWKRGALQKLPSSRLCLCTKFRPNATALRGRRPGKAATELAARGQRSTQKRPAVASFAEFRRVWPSLACTNACALEDAAELWIRPRAQRSDQPIKLPTPEAPRTLSTSGLASMRARTAHCFRAVAVWLRLAVVASRQLFVFAALHRFMAVRPCLRSTQPICLWKLKFAVVQLSG